MNQEQEFSWWIKILGDKPIYIHYFGPFNSYSEAKLHKNNYIQNLSKEENHIIDIQINQCQPSDFHYEDDYRYFMSLSS